MASSSPGTGPPSDVEPANVRSLLDESPLQGMSKYVLPPSAEITRKINLCRGAIRELPKLLRACKAAENAETARHGRALDRKEAIDEEGSR